MDGHAKESNRRQFYACTEQCSHRAPIAFFCMSFHTKVAGAAEGGQPRTHQAVKPERPLRRVTQAFEAGTVKGGGEYESSGGSLRWT
eukprot:365260-Chlamydomonas_euryale.AAC.6